MSQHALKLEDIVDLAEELRLAGFDLGTQQYVAAQDLLLALAAHHRLPNDPRQLRTLLSPIFCSSPGEQEEFYQRFDLWLKRHPEFTPTKEDSIEPDDGKTLLNVATQRLHWMRKPLGIVALCLLVVLAIGAGYLSLKFDQTLTGQILSSTGEQVANAQIEFFGQKTESDREGKFSVSYQARNFRRMFNRQATLNIIHAEHETHSRAVNLYKPSSQNITLQRLTQPDDVKSEPDSQRVPEATPSPVPIDLGIRTVSSGFDDEPTPARWPRLLLAASPLLLFAAWWLWRWRRRRALLQKLQAAGNPQLSRITVKGAADLLFHSQAFRRAVQELRRHRQVAIKELDIASTVRATIGKGGMFTPQFGSRKASPEYLLLIDRANLNDEQARFGEEVSQRLEAGGVFVDRYYFQNDPRTCRLREPHSPMLTLHELAARHPEHQLLIFSDGAGFINPITGEPEHWLTLLGHWPRRVLLTPELATLDDYRELALAENDFFILPATADGLVALTEALGGGGAPKPSSNGHARPFPRLILERPKRWLERNEPRPTVASELCDQLKQYLGDDGWQWLAACAVYPTLSWEVTLYVGYKLFGKTEDFEQRLLSLVRLPWFRYGTMPDWLRLRLIESFTPEQEIAVRRALEDLLLSALDHPREGVELEFAAPAPAEKSVGWRQRLQALKAKLADWRRRRRLGDLLKNEPPESPLRDYVFLGFFSGGGANRLTVNLPEVLRRALFPQGKAVLGMRTAAALLAAIVLAAPGTYWFYRTLRQTTPPVTASQTKFYQQMSRQDQVRFVSEKVGKVLVMLGPVETDSVPTTDPSNYIQDYVDSYARRIGNGSTKTISEPGDLRPTFNEDLSFVFARGIKYAPTIAQAFDERKVPPIIGLYLAMAESEFSSCLKNGVGLDIFQQDSRYDAKGRFLAFNRCNVSMASIYTAASIGRGIEEYGKDGLAITATLAAFQRDQDVQNILTKYPSESKSYWTLASHGNEMPLLAQKEIFEIVPRFLAAAIVGENPQSFGLQMQPLSSYNTTAEPTPTPTVSPKPATALKPATSLRPRATPTPVVPASLCDNDLAAKAGHSIRSIKLQTGDGVTEDIGNEYPLGSLFLRKAYRAGDDNRIKAEAQSLLAARKIDPSGVWVCVSITSCRLIEGCVEIYLRASAGKSGGQRPPTASDPPATANPPAAQNEKQANDANVPSPLSNYRLLARNPGADVTARVNGSEVILTNGENTKELARFAGHVGSVTSAAFNPGGNILATGSNDRTVRLWEPSSGRQLSTLSGFTDAVTSVNFSPDGRTLAVGSVDKTVTLWDVGSGKQLARLASGARVYVVLFSPDGQSLASGGEDGILNVWDSAKFSLRLQIKVGTAIDNLAFRAPTSIRIFGRGNKDLGTWDLTTGEKVPEKRAN